MFCREAYETAEGLLAHIENIGALLAEMLKLGRSHSLGSAGPAEELEKLKKPLAHLNPAWFAMIESKK